MCSLGTKVGGAKEVAAKACHSIMLPVAGDLKDIFLGSPQAKDDAEVKDD